MVVVVLAGPRRHHQYAGALTELGGFRRPYGLLPPADRAKGLSRPNAGTRTFTGRRHAAPEPVLQHFGRRPNCHDLAADWQEIASIDRKAILENGLASGVRPS